MGNEIKHIYGAAGGYLVGNSHENSGIQAINKATGERLEMEGGEVVITEPAVSDTELREFEGEMLTNREILSKINVSGGGVSFAELGAELPTHIDFCGNQYKYGGETLTDYEIAHRISKCGCSHDKETFADGGELETIIKRKFAEGFGKVKYFEKSNSGGSWKYISNPLMSVSERKQANVFTIELSQKERNEILEKRDNYNNNLPKEISILEYATKLAKENNAKITHKSKSGSVYLQIENPNKKSDDKFQTIRISDHYILDRDSMNPKSRYDYEIVQKNFDENDSTDLTEIFEIETFADGGEINFSKKQKQEIIDSQNKFWESNDIYKLSSNGVDVMRKDNSVNPPKYKYYQSFKDFHNEIKQREISKIERENAQKVFEYLEENGAELEHKSVYGSRYYNYKGKSIRVSNHWQTSEIKDPQTGLNKYKDIPSFYSDKIEGYKEMISKIESLINKETFADGGEINLNPKNLIELKNNLEIALEIEDEIQKKKTIEQLQVDFFTNIVAENPKKELTNYYEAISILPKNKRQYFEYWFSEQESEIFQEKLKDNPYNFLPSDLKPEVKIKKLDFSPTPESENLGKIMNIFTGDDALRPKFSGVFFNVKEERIEATDAHKLMFINEKPHLSESMICLMGKRKEKHLKNSNPNLEKNSEGCWRVDESYVDTSRIIPTDFNLVIEIDAKKLLQYLTASEYFSNPVTHQSIISYQYEDKPTYVGFNSDFLADCLKGMLMLGHSDLEMCFMEAKNRAVVIVPKGNSRKVSGYALKTDLTLCMPVRLDTIGYSHITDYSPIYDIENNVATIIGKYENHILETEEQIEEKEEILVPENHFVDTNKMVEENTNIQDTIDGLEILLETAKGKNKTNIIDTIEGLKLLLEAPQFKKGGATDFLLAPNGKPSNLNNTQWHLVRTEAFKNWFGDWEKSPETSSKVVDENGEPLVVYHGTGSEFYVFDKSKAHDTEGRKFGVGTGKGVFSFTKDLDNAEGWMERSKDRYQFGVNSNDLKIISVFLNFKNPVSRDVFEENLNKKFEEYTFRPQKERDKKISEIYKEFKKQKIDGLISDFGEYTAFESNQIKLADGTNTTFDKKTNDIRYKKGGPIENDNLDFRPITTPLN